MRPPTARRPTNARPGATSVLLVVLALLVGLGWPTVQTPAQAQGTGSLVLASFEARNTNWTNSSAGAASKDGQWGHQAINFPAPASIPAGGVTFAWTLTAQATVSNLATECEAHASGMEITAVPNVHASAFSPRPGEANTITVQVTVKPTSVAPGATALLQVGCFENLDLRWTYKSNQVGPAPTTTSTTTTISPKAMSITAGFGTPDYVQELLDRRPVVIQVSAGGAPLPGANVTIESNGSVAGQGVTDANGIMNFEVKLPASSGRIVVALLIRAAKAGYTDAATVLKTELVLRAFDTVITLDPVTGTKQAGEMVTISGTVNSSLGGVRFQAGVPSEVLVTGLGTRGVDTDAAGRFSVAVPASSTVIVQAKPKDPEKYLPSQAELAVDVADPKAIVLEASTDRDVYQSGDVITLNGSVLVDGKPAGALVDVRYADSNGTIRGLAPVSTDSVGAFSVRLPALPKMTPGSRFMITVRASGIGLHEASRFLMVRIQSDLDACRPLTATFVSGAATLVPVNDDNTAFPPDAKMLDGTPLFQPPRAGSPVTDRSELHASGPVVLGFPLPADVASAGRPAAATMAVGVAPGSTVRVVRFCIEPSGKVTLVLASKDRGAIRLRTNVPGGANGNWSISVVTPSATVADRDTDYVVATDAEGTYVTLLEGALSVAVGNAAPVPVTGRQSVTTRAGTGATTVRPLPADVLPIVDDPSTRVDVGRLRAALPAPIQAPAPAPTTTSSIPPVTSAGPVTIAPATTTATPSFFPPTPGSVPRLRVCFSAPFLRTQPTLAALQQTSFAVQITPVLVGGKVKSWQLRIADYPGTLTGQGQWNGKTLKVTKWFTGSKATAAAPQGTATLTYDAATRALVGAWKSAKPSKHGSGVWKLGIGEPPPC